MSSPRICLVCQRPILIDAVQIQLDVDDAGSLWFYRHESCEVDEKARNRLIESGLDFRRKQLEKKRCP